jgi:hypothetical protein
MSFANGGRIVTDGLILSLDASDQNSYISGSTTWIDLSGNNNNGTLVSGSTYSSDNGGNIVLSGSAYVSMSQNINPPNITLEFVYKASVSSPYEYLISNTRDCCGTYNGYELNIVNGVPRFRIWNSTDVFLGGTIGTVVNQIYHITATYDGSQMKIYQNSILTGTRKSTLGIGSPASYNPSIGGMGINPSSYNLTGNIYVGRVYNRALSITEIQQNYNAQKARFGLT